MIGKRATCQSFRLALAKQWLELGNDIGTMQEPLDRKNVGTAQIHARARNRGGRGVLSPADGLLIEECNGTKHPSSEAMRSTGRMLTGPRSLTQVRIVDVVGIKRP